MRKTFGENYKDDIRIDSNNLNEECELQPSLYAFYGENYVEARRKRDEEKDRLDLVLAQREMRIRNNPPDGVKVTEAVVNALLLQDAEVIEQKEAYRIACAEVYTYDVVMSSLDHRKSQLDNLVRLMSMAYFSNKSDSAVADEVGNSMRDRLNRRD